MKLSINHTHNNSLNTYSSSSVSLTLRIENICTSNAEEQLNTLSFSPDERSRLCSSAFQQLTKTSSYLEQRTAAHQKFSSNHTSSVSLSTNASPAQETISIHSCTSPSIPNTPRAPLKIKSPPIPLRPCTTTLLTKSVVS